MTTIVDALTAATAALNAATAEILSLQATLTQQATASQAAATTVINNFNASPISLLFFVDPVNGNDGNNGTAVTTPFQTFDAAMTAKGQRNSATIVLLNNTTISKIYNSYASLVIAGGQVGNSPVGASWSFYQRQLTFASEAVGSPIPSIGRTVAGFYCEGPSHRYVNLNLVLGDPVPGFANPYHHNMFGGDLQCSGCNIAYPGSNNSVAFVYGGDATYSDFEFTGSFSANALGRIVAGVAAGGNPNAIGKFHSNVTSA